MVFLVSVRSSLFWSEKPGLLYLKIVVLLVGSLNIVGAYQETLPKLPGFSNSKVLLSVKLLQGTDDWVYSRIASSKCPEYHWGGVGGYNDPLYFPLTVTAYFLAKPEVSTSKTRQDLLLEESKGFSEIMFETCLAHSRCLIKCHFFLPFFQNSNPIPNLSPGF